MVVELGEHAWWRFTDGWTRKPELYLLRIPKAASSALVWVLKDLALMPTHEYSLVSVPEGELSIAVMRDPIDRFRSAFDMYTTWPKRHLLERFPTIDDFVDAGPDEWASPDWGCGYRRATWWLKSAEYVHERGAIVLDYKTFSDDLVKMGFPKPGVSQPSVRKGTVFSQRSRDILREHYDPDYRLMESLW